MKYTLWPLVRDRKHSPPSKKIMHMPHYTNYKSPYHGIILFYHQRVDPLSTNWPIQGSTAILPGENTFIPVQPLANTLGQHWKFWSHQKLAINRKPITRPYSLYKLTKSYIFGPSLHSLHYLQPHLTHKGFCFQFGGIICHTLALYLFQPRWTIQYLTFKA